MKHYDISMISTSHDISDISNVRKIQKVISNVHFYQKMIWAYKNKYRDDKMMKCKFFGVCNIKINYFVILKSN